MMVVRIHYDGWLALPAAFRQQLGLGSDAVLEVELVDDTIVLRPTVGVKDTPMPEPGVLELPAAAATSQPLVPADAPAKPDIGSGIPDNPPPDAKRKRGRPRKVMPEPGYAATATPEKEEPLAEKKNSGRGRRDKHAELGQGSPLFDVDPWGIFQNLWGDAAESETQELEPAAIAEEPPEPMAEAVVEPKRLGRKPRSAATLPQTLKGRGRRGRSPGKGSVAQPSSR